LADQSKTDDAAPPAEAGKGASVDIHKPKRWRGFRGFLKEYLIIVVGVLTALAAEQGVEWLHWRHKVHLTEKSIRRDLALTADVASERVAIGRCLNERLEVLKAALLGEGGSGSATSADAGGFRALDAGGFPMAYTYHAPSRAWNTAVWERVMADGTLEHFDPERARSLNLLYLTVGSAQVANHEEKIEATDLQVIDDKGIVLSADKKVELIQHIDRLHMLNGELASLSRQILRRIDDAGYLPPLKDTIPRLAGEYSQAMECRYAREDLKERVLRGWFTLHR